MKRFSLSPAQALLAGFSTIIAAGTVLLMLPISSVNRTWMPVIDALFMSASAVTTTGLVVVDPGSYFSLFGQLVIMLLIQIGGLGYMIFIALAVMGLGRKLSLVDKMLLSESIARPGSLDIKKFVRIVIFLTLFFEVLGAVLLTLFWMRDYPFLQAAYYGIFHSISGFCTAGFALFSDGFVRWKGALDFNMINWVIFVAGGIGFFVHYDIYSVLKARINREPGRHFSAYTKMVTMVMMTLIGGSAAVIFLFNTWPADMRPSERVITSLFQSISASTTTGFNTVDIAGLTSSALLCLMFLMFIGASSGSTGGGIKTSTFGVIALFIISFLKGEQDVQFFKRRVPDIIVNRAFAILFIASGWLLMALVILSITENDPFLVLLFELIAAFSSGGLSMGVTASLSDPGKLLLVFTMLLGRLGPLAIGYSLLGKIKPIHYKNATAEMLVG